MSYVYIQSEPTLWTVGFYDPNGKWQPESDHGSPDEAAKRAAWLNGSGACEHEIPGRAVLDAPAVAYDEEDPNAPKAGE